MKDKAKEGHNEIESSLANTIKRIDLLQNQLGILKRKITANASDSSSQVETTAPRSAKRRKVVRLAQDITDEVAEVFVENNTSVNATAEEIAETEEVEME